LPDNVSDVTAVRELGAARRRIEAEVEKVIVGQKPVVEQILTCLFANGHCIIIGVPGLAKTLMVRALAGSLDLDMKRIQFTPDLMPSDIVGTDILEEDSATRNRRFRFQYWENFLQQGGKLADLAFRQPPDRFTRMAAVAETLPGVVLMDTCTAGVRGALLDPQAQERLEEGLTVVNLGNAHTFAALVRGDRLWGIYEHHTGLLTPEKFFSQLARFQAGELTDAEVFDDQGHGCAYADELSREGRPFSFTVITGPRRRLARGWPGVWAAPFGDMMLSGCFGLAAAFLEMEKVLLNLADL
jgi:hypothetical protein